jgi:hypothetical protein
MIFSLKSHKSCYKFQYKSKYLHFSTGLNYYLQYDLQRSKRNLPAHTLKTYNTADIYNHCQHQYFLPLLKSCIFVMRTLSNFSMVLFPQIRFKQRSWRGIRVRVPRPVKARFDEVRSDLSSFIYLNPFQNANFKWSMCSFIQHNV